MECTICRSSRTIKVGERDGIDYYICKKCCRSFMYVEPILEISFLYSDTIDV